MVRRVHWDARQLSQKGLVAGRGRLVASIGFSERYGVRLALDVSWPRSDEIGDNKLNGDSCVSTFDPVLDALLPDETATRSGLWATRQSGSIGSESTLAPAVQVAFERGQFGHPAMSINP